MALRIVEMYLPDGQSLAKGWLGEHPLLDDWLIHLDDGTVLVRALIDSDHTEKFLDAAGEQLGSDGFRVVILPVEATIPHETDEHDKGRDEREKDGNESVQRISREEVYHDVAESVKGIPVYFTLVVLSTVVAAGGMIRDDVAVVVGAMVIAPLIGPNLALALGTTLGDTRLLIRALQVNLLGLLASFVLAVAIGIVVDFTITDQIASRTRADLGALALALAAGVAGALSVTRGISTALIGVMVAVALLPPLVAAGMLLGSGSWVLAYNAGLLLLVNVTSINLAAVLTFVAQGIRPSTWYEEEEAKVKTRYALAGWAVLMALLIVAVLLAPEGVLPG